MGLEKTYRNDLVLLSLFEIWGPSDLTAQKFTRPIVNIIYLYLLHPTKKGTKAPFL
jgi:hypothetical protein